jgi:hypothetical protein
MQRRPQENAQPETCADEMEEAWVSYVFREDGREGRKRKAGRGERTKRQTKPARVSQVAGPIEDEPGTRDLATK